MPSSLLHLDAAAHNPPIPVCAAQARVFRDTALPSVQPLFDVLLKPFIVDDVCRVVQRLIASSQADEREGNRRTMRATDRSGSAGTRR